MSTTLLKQFYSTATSTPTGVFSTGQGRTWICKRLRSTGIHSIESSPPGWESITGLLKRFTNWGSVFNSSMAQGKHKTKVGVLQVSDVYQQGPWCTSWLHWSKISFAEPVFVNLFRSPGIDSQPARIDSWDPETLTKTGSGILEQYMEARNWVVVRAAILVAWRAVTTTLFLLCS